VRCTAGSRDLVANLATRAKTRIDNLHRLQPLESPSVIVQMFGLLAHRTVPAQSEPVEILKDRRGILVTAAGLIDVLKTEEKPSSGASCCSPSFERRADVTEMQVTRRARRKPRHR